MKYDYLVVGSGLYGAIFAHEAKKNGKRVLVIIGAIMLVLISTGCFVYHKKERKH